MNSLNKKGIEITFFVPCLNEELNIKKTIDTIITAAKEVRISYEILVVDDNSSDSTVKAVEDFQKTYPEIPLILKKNKITQGLGRNYVDGAFIGRGKYYMLVNGDNAEPKEIIVAIIKKLDTADMIIPYLGENDNRSFLRRRISAIFTAIVNCTGGYSIKYYNGPVAHLRYNVMRWHSDTEGFAYQAEIITRLLDEGATYTEVAISNFDRNSGISKASNFKNFLSVTHSLLQILFRRIRKILFYRVFKTDGIK